MLNQNEFHQYFSESLCIWCLYSEFEAGTQRRRPDASFAAGELVDFLSLCLIAGFLDLDPSIARNRSQLGSS